MVRDQSEHPSDAVIQAFGQGRTSLADSARLEKHFASCDRCVEKMGRVGMDTYSELIRAGAVTSAPTSADVNPLHEMPRELREHDRYAILTKLGSGGMGVVYQATHRIMKRSVALKVIRPDLVATPLAVSRFRREVQAAARLSHPHIVTAYDAEEVRGVHFLVMEFVDGWNLERWVRERGPLPTPQACRLAQQAALGLHHAHTQQMIHRDVKPANLMLTREGSVKILDFGLACWTAPDEGPAGSITQSGARLGTVAYAAPEQFPATDRVDARADQYGLGATLYFLLTGQAPTADSLVFSANVPPQVAAIVRRMMAVAPADRFASLKEVAVALEPWCEPPAKKVHLRRSLLIATAAFALLALGAFLWMKRSPAEDPPPTSARLPVLFLLPSRGLWYEDYDPARKALEAAGHKVIVATPGGKPASLDKSSMLGKPQRPSSVAADMDLASVEPHHFDAIVCVGFDHSEFTSEGDDVLSSQQAMRLLRLADRAEKCIVGICAGQHVLGSAGLLHGKKAARASEYVDPAGMGAAPQPDRSVVTDGRIVTASTPQDSADAARALVQQLK